MHNGLMSSLRGVLNYYNGGGARPVRKPEQADDPLFPVTTDLLKSLRLDAREIAALERFLHSISRRPVRMDAPALPAAAAPKVDNQMGMGIIKK